MTWPLESIEVEASRLTPDERSLLAGRPIVRATPAFAFDEEPVPLDAALARARQAFVHFPAELTDER